MCCLVVRYAVVRVITKSERPAAGAPNGRLSRQRAPPPPRALRCDSIPYLLTRFYSIQQSGQQMPALLTDPFSTMSEARAPRVGSTGGSKGGVLWRHGVLGPDIRERSLVCRTRGAREHATHIHCQYTESDRCPTRLSTSKNHSLFLTAKFMRIILARSHFGSRRF